MTFKQALTYAVALGVAGLVVGVVAGWVGVIRADGAAEVSAAARPLGYLLIGVVPLSLLAATFFAAGDAELADSFARTGPLIGWLAVAALLGAAAACALFLVASTQIPAIFGGEEAEALMRANRANFGWTKAIAIAGAALLAVLPTALIAKRRASRARA